MTIRVNYTGTADYKVIKRTDITSRGLPDPGADQIWSRQNNFQIDLPNTTAAFLLSLGDFAAANGVGFGDFFANAPIKVISDTSLACGTAQSTWHDLDPSGSAAAKPLDLVVPNVTAGQWVCVTPNLASGGSSSAFVGLDIWTIVAGVPVHNFGPTPAGVNGGVSGWKLNASVLSPITGAAWYQVQQSDIENGAVRLRLRDYNATTTARSLTAGSGYRIELVATGPFG